MDARREARYGRLYEQLRVLIQGVSPSRLAAMSTICAVLQAKMPHHFWTGFYFVASPTELHVGPYQGPVACQVLRERGVCLDAVRRAEPVVVPNVRTYPDHISCDARSESELVIPLFDAERVFAVFDVDSSQRAAFSKEDVPPMRRILSLVEECPPM